MSNTASKIVVSLSILLLLVCIALPLGILINQEAKIANRTNVLEQQTKTLLLNGKTASAISAKKTAGIAQEIENLVIAYHTQTQQSSSVAAKAAESAKVAAANGAKELPILLNQIETAIATQDKTSINVAVQEAVTGVEHYFAMHPTR